MPTELSWYCRLVWIASLTLALVANAEAGTPYRWWARSLGATVLFSPLFWPEVRGWTDSFWPAILGLTVLRTVAAVEAFHFHTRKFIWWSALAGAVFTMAFAFTGLVATARNLSAPTAANLRDAAVNLSAYGNMWCAFALLMNGAIFLKIGGWRRRTDDFHALVVTTLCVIHGAKAFAYVVGPPELAAWRFWDPFLGLSDSVVYFTWAFGVTLSPPAAALPRPRAGCGS